MNLSLGIVLLAPLLLVPSPVAATVDDVGDALFAPRSMQELCDRIYPGCGPVLQIERNSFGTELRFVSDAAIVVIAEQGPPARYEKPARLAWLDDEHRFVAYADSAAHALTLASGEVFANAAYPQPLDWSRRFLLLKEGEDCRVVRLGVPAQEAARVAGPCKQLFSHVDQIHVVGTTSAQRELVVTSFRDDNQRLLPLGTRRLPRPSGRHSPFYVMDISLDGKAFAVENTYDVPFWWLSPSYLLPVRGDRFERLPFSRWHSNQLFLSNALRERLCTLQ